MALMTGDSLYWKTGISTAGLQAGAAKTKGILRGLAGSITRMDVFAGLAIGSALVFAKISKQAYNFSKEFETAMKEVQTISKAVQNDFKGISQEIIDMTKTVPDNAQKLTKALYQIVSAGYDGAKAMEILRTSTELAVATVTDTFTAADVLTYVMNAYGKAAGTAAEISDKLFTIIKLGKVKMDELGPSLSMVTGLAAQVGLSFNELAAMYAEAVKKMQPRIVSTGIRGIITAMLRVSEGSGDAADAARELGIEFDMTALKSKGFKEVLSDIIEKTKGNKAALMRLFPNVRGLIGLLAIMTDEGEGFNRTLAEVENSLGATGKAFKTMMETTENQWAILKNNVMAKMKPLGDYILGFMNEIAKGINIAMSGATDELSKLSRVYSELTDTLQRKKGRIDDLITTIETLKSKTKLTEEETINLKRAEEALMILLPNLGKAFEDAAGKVDILTLAKKGVLEVSLEIMELELVSAEIDKKQAEIEWQRFELGKDKATKEVEKLKKEVDSWYEDISVKQTSYIRELFRTMEMYSLDNYTKQIDSLIQIYDGAGISVRNFGERLKDIQKDMKMGEDTTKEQARLIGEVTDALFARDKGLEEARLDLASAELELGEAENQSRLNVKLTTEELNIRTEAYEKFKEAISKPLISKYYLESEYGYKPPEIKDDTIIPVLTDEQIEEVKDRLRYMASQYKKYLSDVAGHNEEWVEKNNEFLAEEGQNYRAFLTKMEADYKGSAELSRQISDDIYEYNKGIMTERKKLEEELFAYIAEAREKDLQAEKDRFEALIKNLKEGSAEYLKAVDKHNKNILKINEKYDKEIRDKLQAIADEEKRIAEEKERMLQSYFKSYQTTEEKIASIHAETAKLLELTDKKYEKDRLKSIEKQLIAEIKSNVARQEVYEKLAEYDKDLNNKQLESLIKTLEEMKLKYTEYSDIIILLNEKIADSQKQIWENTRIEIDKTVGAIHALADVVGNFDTELEAMINSMADLVGGIGGITIGFSTGDITKILQGLANFLNAFVNLFITHHSDVPELQEEMSKITLELQKQQKVLSQSVGTAQTRAIQGRIDLLKEQIQVYNEMIEAEYAAYGSFSVLGIDFATWDETDIEKVEQWLSSIEATNAEIANLWQQYREILTGVTATSIADAIAEGFIEGLGPAQVFTDTFNDMMRNAITDAFKRTIITKYIKDWYDQFALLAEGGLTAEEIEALTGTYQDMIEAAGEQWEAMQAILEAAGIGLDEGLDEVAITGLTGAIAGITEKTAGLLAGQFQAIRINTVEMLSHMESIIIINARIADNTEFNKYLPLLENINNKLSNATESEYLRKTGGL